MATDEVEFFSGENFEVEAILNDKIFKGKKYFFIKWLNYSDDENTWEPVENIPDDLIQEYLSNKKRKRPGRRPKNNDPIIEVVEHKEPEIASNEILIENDKPVIEVIKSSETNKGVNESVVKETDTSSNKVDESVSAVVTEKQNYINEEQEITNLAKKVKLSPDSTENSNVITNEWSQLVVKITGMGLEDNIPFIDILMKNGHRRRVNRKELHLKCPLILLDYYEKHLDL